MADTLGIGLKVQSQQGIGTEFIVSFYKLSDYIQRQQSGDPNKLDAGRYSQT
jgi:hypothetical protein